MNFTHLHVHSHYSMLDGMSKISDLIKKAKKNGMYAESGLSGRTFVQDFFGIEMEKPEVICRYSSQNNQCIGKRCPFAGINN